MKACAVTAKGGSVAKPVTDVYQRPDLRFYLQQSDIGFPGEFEHPFSELPATAQE